MKVQNFNYYMPVKIFFGEGRLEELGTLTKGLGEKAKRLG